jgi:ER membrane protein complex subunit 7
MYSTPFEDQHQAPGFLSTSNHRPPPSQTINEMHIPLLLPLLIPLAQCTHLRVLIASTTGLSNPGTLPPSTSASLTTLSRQLHAPLRADNSFDFRNVSAGSYLLDIHSHTYEFAPLRVDVHGEVETRTVEPEVQVWGTFRGNEWGNKGEKVDVTEIEKEDKGEAIFAFAVKARGKKEYLVKKQGCEFSLG